MLYLLIVCWTDFCDVLFTLVIVTGIETGTDSRDGRKAKKPKTQGTDGT